MGTPQVGFQYNYFTPFAQVSGNETKTEVKKTWTLPMNIAGFETLGWAAENGLFGMNCGFNYNIKGTFDKFFNFYNNGASSNTKTKTQVSTNNSEIDALKKRIAELEKAFGDKDTTIRDLQAKLDKLENGKDNDKKNNAPEGGSVVTPCSQVVTNTEVSKAAKTYFPQVMHSGLSEEDEKTATKLGIDFTFGASTLKTIINDTSFDIELRKELSDIIKNPQERTEFVTAQTPQEQRVKEIVEEYNKAKKAEKAKKSEKIINAHATLAKPICRGIA